MSFETYGSFRIEFLNDKKGKLLENDELFLNIFDFIHYIMRQEI